MNVAFMDMDLTIVSPTVKWALPVRPDELGWHLEVYQKTLPALTTLRLCHRFGKGPDAHDTKLPFEILDAIETILCDPKHRAYQDYVRWDNWVESFEHFEGRCAPIVSQSDEREDKMSCRQPCQISHHPTFQTSADARHMKCL